MTRILLDLSPTGIADRVARFGLEPNEYGQLRTPLTRYARAGGLACGLDNGCFGGSLPSAWQRMLAEARQDGTMWCASPDVVGSARRTMELWRAFARQMIGVPRALVLQDGIGEFDLPWHEISCVFVGGSDAFKLSPEAFAAARTAKILGKQVHVGRVNTASRLEAWMGLADSIDGSGISRYDHMLRAVLDAMRGTTHQESMRI